jgi:hypothetical protein
VDATASRTAGRGSAVGGAEDIGYVIAAKGIDAVVIPTPWPCKGVKTGLYGNIGTYINVGIFGEGVAPPRSFVLGMRSLRRRGVRADHTSGGRGLPTSLAGGAGSAATRCSTPPSWSSRREPARLLEEMLAHTGAHHS